MYEEFREYLKYEDIKYKDIMLSECSTVKIGGAALCVLPTTEHELLKCISYLYRGKIKYRVLGAMSNTLAPTDGYSGVVIITRNFKKWSFHDNTVTLSCGMRFSSISSMLAELSLSGFEELVGIPGTVGGMIYGNAGAFSVSISDILLSCRVYDADLKKIVTMKKSDMYFGYRNSILKQHTNYTLIDATFFLKKGVGKEEIFAKTKLLSEKRRMSQPYEYPSLGSVFKRPKCGFAGEYIEKAGLKGYRIGGAMVSYKHAGFIVNIGGCTSDDFIAVINKVRNTVYEQFEIELEREVEILQ